MVVERRLGAMMARRSGPLSGTQTWARTMSMMQHFVKGNSAPSCVSGVPVLSHRQPEVRIRDSINVLNPGNSRRWFWTSSVRRFSTDKLLTARNHSSSKVKYTFDAEVGAEKRGRSLKEEITMNEVAVFEHFNPKGRRLPRV